MDYQLTNFIVILHRATRVTRYRGARLKIERREGERNGEKEGAIRPSVLSARRANSFWELNSNETLRHRRNHRGAKLFSLFFGRERRRGGAWGEGKGDRVVRKLGVWTGKEDKLWIEVRNNWLARREGEKRGRGWQRLRRSLQETTENEEKACRRSVDVAFQERSVIPISTYVRRNKRSDFT